MTVVKKALLSARTFYQQVKVNAMLQVEPSNRTSHIASLGNNVSTLLAASAAEFEKLTSTQIKTDDLGDLVERGMLDAAKAIQDAALRLEALMNRPAADLNVHASILAAALAITTAIANLVRWIFTDSGVLVNLSARLLLMAVAPGPRVLFIKRTTSGVRVC